MIYGVKVDRGSQVIILISIFCATLLPAAGHMRAARLSPSSRGSELIDLMNQLRVADGLSPYQANSILMGTAQGQSDYQASIGESTHTGLGGSSPIDCAKAAGYGGGAQIFISENIAGGTSLSPETAVEWWQGDAPHLNTLSGPNYTDDGAGAAVSGNIVYYTLDVRYSVGGSGNTVPPTLASGTPGATYVSPVVTSTPKPDGSIVHIVQYGQALYSIAVAYGVTIAYLKDLNGLTSDRIYEGDRLIIRLALPPTPTGLATPTPSRTPRPTRTYATSPTIRVKTPTQITLQNTPTPTTFPVLRLFSGITKDPVLMGIILLATSGGILMLIGIVLRRRG
jgi:LysM repeat protein